MLYINHELKRTNKNISNSFLTSTKKIEFVNEMKSES
jgi:hypothetical protein